MEHNNLKSSSHSRPPSRHYPCRTEYEAHFSPRFWTPAWTTCLFCDGAAHRADFGSCTSFQLCVSVLVSYPSRGLYQLMRYICRHIHDVRSVVATFRATFRAGPTFCLGSTHIPIWHSTSRCARDVFQRTTAGHNRDNQEIGRTHAWGRGNRLTEQSSGQAVRPFRGGLVLLQQSRQ